MARLGCILDEDRVYPDQVGWAVKAHQVLSKPANEINEQDASGVMSKEVGYNPLTRLEWMAIS